MNEDELRDRMAGVSEYATDYQSMMFGVNLQRIDLTEEDLRDGDAQSVLSFFLRYHAFARAGGEQAGYGSIAYSAFDSLGLDNDEEVPPTTLWDAFVSGCEDEGKGVNERLNRGVVTGLANLANRRGNLFVWVRDEVQATGELRPVYLELNDITGIGRKIATFMLRDIVWFWDLEAQVANHDREYLHPIDRWVRRVAVLLWPELDGADRAAIAQHLAQECDAHDISNAEFNQGAWYLGARELNGNETRLESTIQRGFE
jgi:hypothetical protein